MSVNKTDLRETSVQNFTKIEQRALNYRHRRDGQTDCLIDKNQPIVSIANMSESFVVVLRAYVRENKACRYLYLEKDDTVLTSLITIRKRA